MVQENYKIKAAIDYHEGTKHSELSVRIGSRMLDFSNKPSPFKLYRPKLRTVPLPHEFPHPAMRTTKAIASFVDGATTPKQNIDIKLVAELLFFSGGLTRKMRVGGTIYYMRAASATGALYPIELYVVSQELPGLAAGVYHFDPLNFALTELRRGDYRGTLGLLAGENVDVASAPFTIIFASLAWKNAWKYEARSYRHWFWDSGVIAANLLAASVSESLRTKLVMGFVDGKVDKLLGLKEEEEATIALVPVGIRSWATKPQEIENLAVTPLNADYVPFSPHEERYAAVWSMNNASSLTSVEEVRSWTEKIAKSFPRVISDGSENRVKINLIPLETSSGDNRDLILTETVLQRVSTRRFARKSIPLTKISEILRASTSGVPLVRESTIADVYLIANAVESLPLGSYFFNRAENGLEQLKLGNFRNMASYLCLGQPLLGDASVVLFLMAPLNSTLKELGNRGYRVIQFESGIIAGKVYLAAYSLGLGASGSTFYDDAVTEFFSPHASGRNAMIAVGVGVPDYKAQTGKILVGDVGASH